MEPRLQREGTEGRVVRSWAICEGNTESEGHVRSPGRRVALEPGLDVSRRFKGGAHALGLPGGRSVHSHRHAHRWFRDTGGSGESHWLWSWRRGTMTRGQGVRLSLALGPSAATWGARQPRPSFPVGNTGSDTKGQWSDRGFQE